MRVAINTGINDDINFLSDVLAEALLEEGDVYLTHRNASVNNVKFRCISCLGAYPAVSSKQLLNLGRLARLGRILYRAEVLYLLAPNPVNIPLLALSKLFTKRLVAVVHDVKPHYGGLRGFLYTVQNRLIFSAAASVFCFSQFSADQAKMLYRHTDVHVLPLSSPIESFRFRPDSVDARRQFNFVWWGRPERYKGIDVLPAFARKIAEHGMNLLVISKFSTEDPVLAELSTSDNVMIVRERLPLEQLALLIQSAEVNLCPYVTATQSGVVPFSTYLGVPTLAHDVGGISSQVLSGRNGLLVKSILSDDAIAAWQKLRTLKNSDVSQTYWDLFSTLQLKVRLREILS